jgi:tRNA dimethylallyltransferase
MPEPSSHSKIAAILGPTAVGKSRLAAAIAANLDAEIVSVDSMQVYRGMDIATAKPGISLRKSVPHHMLDICDVSHIYSVAEYQEQAREVIDRIYARGKLPLLVGGSGLYFEAVVFDIHYPPASQDDNLRQNLERWSREDPEGMRKRLAEVDADFAGREDFANIRRVIRALEVYERSGRPISHFQKKRGHLDIYYQYVGAVLNAPRPYLNQVIDDRVDEMLAAGLIDEVKELAAAGPVSKTARQALGCKEVLQFLDREKSLEETISDIKKRSRQYAKRQLTWLRRISGLRWFELQPGELGGEAEETALRIQDYLEEELG